MRFFRTGILMVAALLAACDDHQPKKVDDKILLEDMGIEVSAKDNRPVSFTNKRSAYFYTQTHSNDHQEHSWYNGLNLAQARLFAGYLLKYQGQLLDPQTATVEVYPHKLVRTYPNGIVEKVQLFDDRDVIRISMENARGEIALKLLDQRLRLEGVNPMMGVFSSTEDENSVIGVSPLKSSKVRVENEFVYVDGNSGGFFVYVAQDAMQLMKDIELIWENHSYWLIERQQRMETLLQNNIYQKSNDAQLDLAMRWIALNTDQLITSQSGQGIYAGLPWFNEYWGRDSFISLPGATLVTGQFNTARDIITSFAEFQDKDPDSKFFGRVPNIVKVGQIDYHTTDGTPRFVIAMGDYVKYTGDTSLIEEMYPVVKNSIDGAIKNWVDDKGYLLHADNETWMDARHHLSKVAYSPRGNRANDIQALWFAQLNTGIYFAKSLQDKASLQRWTQLAKKLKKHFRQDFQHPDVHHVIDRIDVNDKPDFRLRPNQLYALDMLDDKLSRIKATKEAWQHLVYPWGVASLDNRDDFFHPFHVQWDNYHKDQAYHNGTVWLWNNGIAMQRMIEAGQIELAFELFNNMNQLALQRGVVGGLAENSNAYLRDDEQWPQLTGTYLQAWSNAEHLRVWYQYFLGIRPDLISKRILLAPRLPQAISDITFKSPIGKGILEGSIQKGLDEQSIRYQFNGMQAKVILDLANYDKQYFKVADGDELVVSEDEGSAKIKLSDKLGNPKQVIVLQQSEVKRAKQQQYDEIMKDVTFAKPRPLSEHKVLTQLN
jgi:hypothetical protein